MEELVELVVIVIDTYIIKYLIISRPFRLGGKQVAIVILQDLVIWWSWCLCSYNQFIILVDFVVIVNSSYWWFVQFVVFVFFTFNSMFIHFKFTIVFIPLQYNKISIGFLLYYNDIIDIKDLKIKTKELDSQIQDLELKLAQADIKNCRALYDDAYNKLNSIFGLCVSTGNMIKGQLAELITDIVVSDTGEVEITLNI